MQKRKISTMFLVALFVAAFLLVVLCSQLAHEHDCSGSDCPICAVLHFAKNFNLSIKKLIAIESIFAFAIGVLYYSKGTNTKLEFNTTPVSLSDILTM